VHEPVEGGEERDPIGRDGAVLGIRVREQPATLELDPDGAEALVLVEAARLR
jgi:hypothetical protein